jgi:hypothetical protein
MNEFLENLKREAEANPTMTLVVVGGLLAGAAKLIDATAHHKGATAFAKGEARRQKAAK